MNKHFVLSVVVVFVVAMILGGTVHHVLLGPGWAAGGWAVGATGGGDAAAAPAALPQSAPGAGWDAGGAAGGWAVGDGVGVSAGDAEAGGVLLAADAAMVPASAV